MPDNGFAPVWNDDESKIEIGVSVTSATPPVWTYAPLCAGIKSMTPSMNEVVLTEQYYCGEGFAHNEVTGMAPQIQVTGDRVVGDAAQDYIAGLQWKLGSDRVTSVKLTRVESGTTKTYTFDATITDIVAFGGDSTALKPFNCVIRPNGKPVIT